MKRFDPTDLWRRQTTGCQKMAFVFGCGSYLDGEGTGSFLLIREDGVLASARGTYWGFP